MKTMEKGPIPGKRVLVEMEERIYPSITITPQMEQATRKSQSW